VPLVSADPAPARQLGAMTTLTSVQGGNTFVLPVRLLQLLQLLTYYSRLADLTTRPAMAAYLRVICPTYIGSKAALVLYDESSLFGHAVSADKLDRVKKPSILRRSHNIDMWRSSIRFHSRGLLRHH
jgi:hypothetical protein